jgi:SAM-dependent MidA family methyltransferase
LVLPVFIHGLVRALKKGVIFLADYGEGEKEHYHPLRTQGTLACFYRHQIHGNPLLRPGMQDITAQVNFTQVAENALQAGAKLGGFTTQAAFLLSTGLMKLMQALESNLTASEQFSLHQALKYLTLPTEMGERVKFMALVQGMDLTLEGFALQDRRQAL